VPVYVVNPCVLAVRDSVGERFGGIDAHPLESSGAESTDPVG